MKEIKSRPTLISRLLLILLLLLGKTVAAEEVRLEYRGLTLNGNLEPAGRGTNENMILITHGGLAHHGMEFIVYLQQLLRENGYASLAITLSLGLDDRRGMYDCSRLHRHRQEGAVDEIDAWLNWLARQGAKRVVLLGHSRGGVQTALHTSRHQHPLVAAQILLAPATLDNGALGYEKRYAQALAPLLKRAQQLIDENKSETILDQVNMMFCRNTQATAAAFVSYYRDDPDLDTPYLLTQTTKATLVLIAGDDQVVLGLEGKLPKPDQARHLRIQIIEGADHFFRDLYTDEGVEKIIDFLKVVNFRPVN